MKKIAVLVSGGGTNLQALIDAEAAKRIKNGTIALVLSSNEDAYALKRAEAAGIETVVVSRKPYKGLSADKNRTAYTEALLQTLSDHNIDLVVLAGFMYILSPEFISAYTNRIINVHPSLIPSFCGDGYYGLRVHEAVLKYGVKLTGATAHFVNEETDGGPIILQKAVDVLFDDSPETLQKRVMEQAEWSILPQSVSLFCEDRLEIRDRYVVILPPKAEN